MNSRSACFVMMLVALLWPWTASAEIPTYRWGGGSKKGGFTKISKAIAVGLKATGAEIAIDVQTTKGSCDNIKRLLRRELDFALAQYDVAAEAYQAGVHARLDTGPADDNSAAGAGGFMCEISADMAAGVELRLVTAVTDGAVHVLVRRPVRIDNFQDLRDHRVYLGRKGSGSFETSKVIVGAAGLTVDRLDRLDSGTSKAFAALRSSEIIMMLRTTEPGDENIGRVIADGVATVNPLPADVTERLIDGYPYYRICQIEANTYPGMDVVVPTVCVSTVVLTALPAEPTDVDAHREAVALVLGAVKYLEDDPEFESLHIHHRWRGFAESEPIPIHAVAAELEDVEDRNWWLKVVGASLLALAFLLGVRRVMRRRGLLKDPLEANIEGQLSNPLIPFAGFLGIVLVATVLVWWLEHDSNARVRTLNDSFWEMNMFATGNFDTEALKTSTARFIGAAATIAGLGLLAWFTAALTNIFARDQMRIWRRLKNHIVILNFREDMLQLIRMLRSPGPMRSRPIHVVISDELPTRVRLQLARIKGVTIYQRNPEVPEDLLSLRIPRAARVIVLQSDKDAATQYHPLRVSRAVHQACSKFGIAGTVRGPELGKTGFSVAPPTQAPALAGDDSSAGPSLPVTLVEAPRLEPIEIFDPFRRWLIPIKERQLANHWMVTACVDPGFAEVFNGVVSFRDENSEAYTVPMPEWFHGKTWRTVRRTLLGLEARAGVIPIGLYRANDATLAYDVDDVEESSPQQELQKRMVVNPPLDTIVGDGDRLLAFAEDEADLRKIMRASRRAVANH
ncbi:MAG: hypothetical protein JKY37_21630 [Nannocystaceae bacterium]|nr:hypothetical protein [Nannocystaceae bacterium]